MKSSDEIKKGLECCTIPLCDECPYDNDPSCVVKNADALALIQQLEADKQQLEGMLAHMNQLRDAAAGRALKMEERVHQLEAERDAAVEDLEDYATLKCFACKYYEMELTEAPCDECKIMGKGNRDMFEWRGVQKEE